MAADLVKRSPLTVEYITDKFDTAHSLASSAITPPIQPIETPNGPDTSYKRDTQYMSQKSFVLNIFPSDGYKHKTFIRQSPLHGPWPKAGLEKETFVYNALREVMPDGPGAEAFCDWQTGGQLSDEARMERSQEESAKLAHINDRRSRRQRVMKKDRSFGSPAATAVVGQLNHRQDES